MDIVSTNPELELALNFVEKTDRNIFLTGKAGTGKTTFLHKIKAESNKRLVVVAPTGVAAINAKGVTIHSFFQMPFGPLVPDGTDKKSKYRFAKAKIDIIRSLDLLIIDEISMVRADLLDGIDKVLRRYKDRNKVFGGVQVLMIGDLQQLAPVVKPYEWDMLRSYYDTMYFFSSLAFKKANVISIELKHIYRQADKKFISILNEVRNNTLSEKSAAILNERYQADFSPKKEAGYITLTTHNNRASAINEQEIKKLKGKSKFYNAQVEGKFNEYAYPTKDTLELKVGAQVMFIKNDSSYEKRYYNGKIGTITHLEKNTVWVNCNEEDDIETVAETWENISYTIDPETKEITETKAGSFSQIPLRLAWAITIHKSQGLTFDKAIIDAEASFAHGQTYVALSRCKSLEGIVLKTQIKSSSIINDSKVVDFTTKVKENLPNETDLNQSQKIFQLNLVEDLFSYQAFLYPVQRLIRIYYDNKTTFAGNIIKPLTQLKDEGIVKLMQVSTQFKKQLQELSQNSINPEEDKTVQERITKAMAYFKKATIDTIQQPLNQINFTTENKAIHKDFSKQLDQLEDLLTIKLFCFNALSKGFNTMSYLSARSQAVLLKTDLPKVVKKRAAVTATTHPVLFDALKAYRAKVAKTKNIDHFQVFTQKSLFEMCEYFPMTKADLKAINGMGKVRIKEYGDAIIKIITAYFLENDVQVKEVEYVDVLKSVKKKKGKKNTKLISLELFQKGKTIDEIAKERELVSSTIIGHLVSFIATGEVKITDLMPEDKFLELQKIMKNTDYESFSELKNKIDAKFTYPELRMVADSLEVDS